MKRFIAVLLALVLVLGLAACGTTEAPAPPETTPDPTPEATPEPPAEESNAYAADIVIIGGGAAGLTAAAQAVYDGATNVVILEQSTHTGGVGRQAFGGINAAESRYQVATGEYSTVEDMINWVMNPGVTNPELVRRMAEHSAPSIHWLNDFANAGFTVLMGDWAHRPDVGDMSPINGGVGVALVDALNQVMLDHNVPVLLNTTATEILMDESGAVAGVVAMRDGEEITIEANAVVIATGATNIPVPALLGFDTTAPGYGVAFAPGSTNGGIQLAYNAGGEFTVPVRPLAVAGPPNLDYTRDLFEAGAVLVNLEGDTFIDVPSATDMEITAAVQGQTDAAFFVVFNEEMAGEVAAFEVYEAAGFLVSADTIEALAEQIGVDATSLAASVDFAGPFYAGRGTASVLTASTGIRINENAEVIAQDGGIVRGLYAAGPVVGGIQGYGRHGGSTLMEVLVFGRIAGESVAEFIDANFGHTASSMPHSDELTFAAELAAVPPQTIELGELSDLEDGVFVGSARAYMGQLYVQVTVEDGVITEVVVTQHSDTGLYMMMATAGVIPQIVAGDATIDAATGATASSFGIVEAVRDALGL